MPGIFEINKAKNGQFYFNLKAPNGEIILTSEMYKQKESAKNGIASVQKNSPDPKRYKKLVAKNGQFYFVLRAANHQVIGNSEMYKAEDSREKGITSVKKNGPAGKVKDLTIA